MAGRAGDRSSNYKDRVARSVNCGGWLSRISRPPPSIHLVMGADRYKQNDLVVVLLRDFKDNSQVIARAASPEAGKIALEFVAPQFWIEHVIL